MLLSLPPFSSAALQVCSELSKKLLQQAERPDLASLGFWLRPAHINELRDTFAAMHSPQTLLVPRGLAFHIPPANVEVMAIYSWIASLLVGNANIVRWPTSASLLLRTCLEEVLPLVKDNTRFITYGHDDEVTADLSAQADIRIIWGGDATIEAIRRLPLKPRAKEIVFADRRSFALINADMFLQTAENNQKRLAEDFFNDMFWFDQRACSSPHSVVWIGGQVPQAREQFYRLLTDRIAQKNYRIPLAARLEKMAYAYAAAIEAVRVEETTNELSVVFANRFPDEHCGHGLLYDLQVADLDALGSLVTKKDQTLSYFGLPLAQLREWIKTLNGRGIDRIVPIGQALQFELVWDGYDLLQELSSMITIR